MENLGERPRATVYGVYDTDTHTGQQCEFSTHPAYLVSPISFSASSVFISLLVVSGFFRIHSFVLVLSPSCVPPSCSPDTLRSDSVRHDTMNPAVTNLVLMLVCMQVSKKLDFEDPTTLFYVRLAFIVGQSLTLLIYLYVRFVIVKKNDLTTLKYLDAPNKMAGESESKLVTTTIKDYDLKQIDSAIKGVFTGLAMTGFMHLYMKFANPLVMQSISPVKGALEANIVKIHLFNTPAVGDLKRPFKAAPSILSGLTGGDVKTDKSSIEKAETAGTGGVKED